MRESLRRDMSEYAEVAADANTKWIINGQEVDQLKIKNGDLVFIVGEKKGDPKYGYTQNPRIIAIVKASLEAKYYEVSNDNRIVQHVPCGNNPTESCIDGSGFPVYSSMPDTGPLENADQERMHAKIVAGEWVEFEGKITAIVGDTYTITTSTGRSMAINMPAGFMARRASSTVPGYIAPAIGSVLQLKSVATSRDVVAYDDIVYIIEMK